MPVSLTIKNIPDALYEQLRAAAAGHHRSLNGEVIACLENSYTPKAVNVADRLQRARNLRAKLANTVFDPADIAAYKTAGRE